MQSLVSPTSQQLMNAHTDIASVDEPVSIEISNRGNVVWVNVAGICVLRIQGATNVVIKDERKPTN